MVMQIGGSLFLIALGAILKFAVATQNSHGFDIGTIGVILMIVGAVGLIISLIFMANSGRRTTVIDRGPDGPVDRY
jgi:Domain of unknown function (DUF6458)